jgi:uncharacterized membrane protein
MASPTPGKTQLGLDQNVAGLLCYLPLCCVGFIFSIVVVIVEKQSRLVKFHALQSLLLQGAAIVVFVVLQIGMMVMGAISSILGTLVWALMLLVSLALFAVAVLMMVKAYNNEEYLLPVIGGLARKWSSQ